MNRKLLEYCVARAGYKPTEMAKKLGVSRQAYYKKLSGDIPFKHTEMCVLIAVCGLTLEEVRDIFFANVVAA